MSIGQDLRQPDPAHFRAVCWLLRDARGEDNAMTLDEITARAGLPNRRTAEALIEQRLQDFPYPLVASGAGYFIPTQAEQINTYLRSLRGRALKCFLRMRSVNRKALAQGWKREGKWFARPPLQLDLFEPISVSTTKDTKEDHAGLSFSSSCPS
jgi:hypothetical protein